MAKILGSWSGMRKYLEQEMLAASLAGRIRYGCTHYTGMDNDRIFEIRVDGKQVKRFSLETVNAWFAAAGLRQPRHPMGSAESWDGFWDLMAAHPMSARPEYTADEFCDALAEYRRQDIQSSLASENPLVRMFAILDRRAGRRTLAAQKALLDAQPEWLQAFYRLRLEAEGLI